MAKSVPVARVKAPRRGTGSAAAVDLSGAPAGGWAAPDFASVQGPEVRVYVGDCREAIPRIPECARGEVDLVFADPPFNWNRAYDEWRDEMPEAKYLDFTYDWIDLCAKALRPAGSLWINIPDDWAGEIVCYLKGRLSRQPARRMQVVDWCVWHYRFGQNTTARFINSKVHALHFNALPEQRVWKPERVLELSDRASTYGDKRTLSKKDGMPAGLRVPMDVWYGKHWGRVQGNNKERRGYHDNQLPEVYLHRVIASCTEEGALVMDPFTGSGTTATVARAMNRRYVGTEFSRQNAENAFRRATEIGLARPLPAGPESTAIFPQRRTLQVPGVGGVPGVPEVEAMDGDEGPA